MSYQDYDPRDPRGLSVRFDFDVSGRCEAIEFLWPRRFPPTVDTHRLAGPTIRESAQFLTGMGYEAWNDHGIIADLPAACKPESSSVDTILFHELGLSLWTDLGTETDDGTDFGEYLLDTVLIWRPGYWEEANDRWAAEGKNLRVAVPERY